MKLVKGKYSYMDLDTGKKHTVCAFSATESVTELNKKLGKRVNYSFTGYKN